MAAICSLAAFSEVASSELSLRWYNRCRAHQVRSLSLPLGLRAPEPRGIFGTRNSQSLVPGRPALVQTEVRPFLSRASASASRSAARSTVAARLCRSEERAHQNACALLVPAARRKNRRVLGRCPPRCMVR
jgi:hypothetical protein